MHFYLNDWNGSRRVQTDYEGVVEQTCTNLPYGNGEICSPTPSEFLYGGLERDSESGLDHAMFRQYSSAFGMWTTPDPYNGSYNWSNPQSLNRYAYVGGSPLGGVDPSGLDAVTGCQTIYVSPAATWGTDVAACGLSALDSISVFARISDALSPIVTPIAEAAPGVGELVGAADLIYDLGQSLGWWGGSPFHGNIAASWTGKSVPDGGIVNVPGPPNAAADDDHYLFQAAFHTPQAQASWNSAAWAVSPQGIASWYGASAVGAVGALGIGAVGGTAELTTLGLANPATTTSVFWSGEGAKAAAEGWAGAHEGATTLEMTAAGQETQVATQGLDWFTQARPMWVNASQNFARAAAGDVYVFQGPVVGLNSVWATIEYPALLANPNVINIVFMGVGW